MNKSAIKRRESRGKKIMRYSRFIVRIRVKKDYPQSNHSFIYAPSYSLGYKSLNKIHRLINIVLGRQSAGIYGCRDCVFS